jgi:Tfp pilus assembly protein FimT
LKEKIMGNNKNIQEQGRSMVEMLGVLAIIGVLSVGAIAGYSKAMNKHKINKTTDQIALLVANIRTTFATKKINKGRYTELNNASAIRFGIVPNDMYTGTPDTNDTTYEIRNIFNGNVVLQPSIAVYSAYADSKTTHSLKTISDSDPSRSITFEQTGSDAYIIAYDGLSNEACVALATADWGANRSGLIGIAAGAGDTSDLIGTSTFTASSNGGNEIHTFNKTGLANVYVNDKSSCIAQNGLVVAAPGGSSTTTDATTKKSTTIAVTTPINVAYAVAACTGGGSGNAVAWKYH